MIFSKAYEKYVEYMDLKLECTTAANIKRKFRLYILPYFENENIESITPLKYFEWQKEIDKKPLSFSYKRSLHYAMSSFYKYLDLFLFSQKNIPRIVGCFKEKTGYYEMKYWNIEEYRKFINTFDNEEIIYKYFFEFLFFTGCRLGEANAITFDDMSEDILFINKSITKEKYDGQRVIKNTKTKESTRKIRIDKTLVNEIETLKNMYMKKYSNFNEHYYIFGGIKPLAPTTIERYKNIHCKIANVKQIRLHDFRHSHATLLIKQKIPIEEVSRRLGHSDINLTIKTYSHFKDDYEKNVMNSLNSLHFN